jgi:hypothetical protein
VNRASHTTVVSLLALALALALSLAGCGAAEPAPPTVEADESATLADVRAQLEGDPATASETLLVALEHIDDAAAWAEAFDVGVALIHRLSRPPSSWDLAVRLSERLAVVSRRWATPGQQLELRHAADLCVINRDATADYEAGVAVVKAREVDRYDEARRHLAAIPEDATLYPDAQAYLQWIDADVRVREAVANYLRGEVALALAKLEDTLAMPVLGPEARRSVELRGRRWSQTSRALQEGRRAWVAGELEAARAAFELALEGSRPEEALAGVARAGLDALTTSAGEVSAWEQAGGDLLVAVLALPEQTLARWEAATPGAQAETWGEEPEGGWSNDPDPWSDDDWEDE